ncbi:AP-4 complex accessory subunit tepsin-like [Elysia marginata]|uniref:AP-4 complex accessory subunit tepsin-like n=1 Tax=Elysia marginata TaxID=1093978 RepID=A0AAV4FEZ6_9GAST|nr:AP-4 complex accessory subunit tepsin-like [Elysia marginata]
MQSSGTINLPSQRISFVNKISLILKATSDDESVTPGYLYKEINDISYESVGYSESLVEFLTDRLKNNSCHVKYKVLKLIKHLVENGSREFKLGIRRHSPVIQECIKFGGPPHPMHGNTPYLMVRKIATEVCEDLYSMAPEGVKSPLDMSASEKPPELKYGGLGPARTRGSIQGFGNTPTNQSKSLGETILGGLEKLGAKMTETASTRQAALLANLDMSGSTRNYQPPSLPPSLYPGSSQSDSAMALKESANGELLVTQKKPARKPTPGKAGGGWGDDDDEDDDDNDNHTVHKILSTKQSSIDSDSLADLTSGPQTDTIDNTDTELQADWSQENELLTQTLCVGSTGPGGELLAPSDIAAFRDKAARMCCPLLVELLAQKLVQPHHGIALRALQLLEGLVYNSEELVPADNVVSICQRPLVDCFVASQTEAQTLNLSHGIQQDYSGITGLDHAETSAQNDLSSQCLQEDQIKCSKNYSCLVNTLYAKTAKLILSLQQISSCGTEIMPTSYFKGFLPAD